jgi:hypothetical protein
MHFTLIGLIFIVSMIDALDFGDFADLVKGGDCGQAEGCCVTFEQVS